MSELKVIDVSKWQGVIDWDKVKASGEVDAVMMRAGYGNGNVDIKFRANADACTRLGIPFGVYWFSYAFTPDMAEDEAQHCLDAIRPYELRMPVAFDWEYDSYKSAVKNSVTPTAALVQAMARTFCAAVEKEGLVPMLYTNIDYQNRFFPLGTVPGIDRWLAAYRSTRPSTPHAMWQYTASGTVPGIGGKVDRDLLYVDYPAIIAGREEAPDYAALVCERCGFADETRAYLDQYRFAPDLWRKLWEAMEA